jgi:chromosome segregation ATPase
MTNTPRTDNYDWSFHLLFAEAQKMERELNAANSIIRQQQLLDEENLRLQERIKRLEEELERTKEDRNAIAKNTREPLLLKLDHANERISKLNDYVAALETAGDLMANELSYGYDVDMWHKAKEAKP